MTEPVAADTQPVSEREPGWYWVRYYDKWEAWELRPNGRWAGHDGGWHRPPAIIGPRIYTPDEAKSHQLDGDPPPALER